MDRLSRFAAALAAMWCLLPLPAGAQATADTSQYAVAYVGVAPSSRTPAIAAFNRYREASRAQEGFVRFELFEQVDRPGQFAVIETWRDAPAFAARAAGTPARQFQDAMQTLRLTGYDERPYKTFTTAAAASAVGRDRIHVVSHVDIIGGVQGGGPDLVRKQADASRQEAGNLRFDVLQHTTRANHFTVVETWVNQRALEAHAAAAHTRQYREAMQPVTGSPIDERVYKIIP